MSNESKERKTAENILRKINASYGPDASSWFNIAIESMEIFAAQEVTAET